MFFHQHTSLAGRPDTRNAWGCFNEVSGPFQVAFYKPTWTAEREPMAMSPTTRERTKAW